MNVDDVQEGKSFPSPQPSLIDGTSFLVRNVRAVQAPHQMWPVKSLRSIGLGAKNALLRAGRIPNDLPNPS